MWSIFKGFYPEDTPHGIQAGNLCPLAWEETGKEVWRRRGGWKLRGKIPKQRKLKFSKIAMFSLYLWVTFYLQQVILVFYMLPWYKYTYKPIFRLKKKRLSQCKVSSNEGMTKPIAQILKVHPNVWNWRQMAKCLRPLFSPTLNPRTTTHFPSVLCTF